MSRIVPRPQRAGPELSLTPRPVPFGFMVVATLGVTGAVEARPEWRCDASESSACPSAALSVGVPSGSPEAALRPVAWGRGVWSEEAQTPGSSLERELFSHSSFLRRAGYLYNSWLSNSLTSEK